MDDSIRYVEARGARFAVHGFGSGTPVLALHGGFATGRTWIDMAAQAALRNVRLIAPDARGHGLSTPTPEPRAYAISELAADALAIADQLDLDRVAFVGSSMGTRTAAFIAANHPRRVVALGLSLPPPASEESGPARAFRALAADIRAVGFEKAIETMRRDNPAVADNMSRMPRASLPDVLVGVVGRGFEATPDELDRIDCPTRVLGREGDPGHTVGAARFYADHIPDAVLKIIPFDQTDTERAKLIEWAAKTSRAVSVRTSRSA